MFSVPLEFDSPLAQMVERPPCKREVLGSNPGVGNIFHFQILNVYKISLYLGSILSDPLRQTTLFRPIQAWFLYIRTDLHIMPRKNSQRVGLGSLKKRIGASERHSLGYNLEVKYVLCSFGI